MTANDSQNSSASGCLNTQTIADAALNTLGSKVPDLTGQRETVDKVVTHLQENVLGTNASNEQSTTKEDDASAKKEASNTDDHQIENFLRSQYRSYKK